MPFWTRPLLLGEAHGVEVAEGRLDAQLALEGPEPSSPRGQRVSEIGPITWAQWMMMLIGSIICNSQ